MVKVPKFSTLLPVLFECCGWRISLDWCLDLVAPTVISWSSAQTNDAVTSPRLSHSIFPNERKKERNGGEV